LEFAETNLEKSDFDLMEAYFEYKRSFKTRSKALYRDLEKQKRELKQKTIAYIESEVAE